MSDVKERKLQQPWTQEQRDTLERMHAQGIDMAAIASAIGRSRGNCNATLSRIKRDRLVGKTTYQTRQGWTADEIAELIRLREIEKLVWPEIDKKFGRSPGSCCSRYSRLVHVRARATSSSREQARAAPALRERDNHKQLAHATLTAAIFGDPLPGRSALDEWRNAGKVIR